LGWAQEESNMSKVYQEAAYNQDGINKHIFMKSHFEDLEFHSEIPEKQEIHLQKEAEEEVAPVQHPEKRLKF